MGSLRFGGTTADFVRGGVPAVVAPPMTIAALVRPRVAPAGTVCIGGLMTSTSFNNSYLLRFAPNFRLTVRDTSDLHINASTSIAIGSWAWGVARITATDNAEAIWAGDFANKGISTTAKTVTSGAIDRHSFGKRDSSANDQPFDGMIHCAAIWNAALTDAEITALNQGVHPWQIRPQSLVHLYDDMALLIEIKDLVGGGVLAVNGSALDNESPTRLPLGMLTGGGPNFGVSARKIRFRISDGDVWSSAAEIIAPTRPFSFSAVHDPGGGTIWLTLDDGTTSSQAISGANDQDGALIVGAGLDAGSVVDESTDALGVSALTLSGGVPNAAEEERVQLQHAEWLAPAVTNTSLSAEPSTSNNVPLSAFVDDKGQGWSVVSAVPQAGIVTAEILTSDTIRIQSSAVSGSDTVVCAIRNQNPRPMTRFLNVFVTVTSSAKFANGYAYEKTILASKQDVVPGSATGLAVRISLTDLDLRTTGSGGKVFGPNGEDIRFETEDGQQLAHHIRSYDGATGALDVNIRMLSWSPSDQSVPIRMFYGDDNFAGSQQNITGTWLNYLAAWDCRTGVDFTSNGRDLTVSNVSAATLIGDAGDYNGSTSVGVLDDGSFLDGLSQLTVSGWIEPDVIGTDKGIISQGPITGPDNAMGMVIRFDAEAFNSLAANTYAVQFAAAGGGFPRMEFAANAQATEATHLAVTWQAGVGTALYLNGEQAVPSYTSPDNAGSQALQVPEGALYLGAGPKDSASGGWDGVLDEFRIYSQSVSQAFVSTEYLTQLRRATWYGISSENVPAATRYPVAATVYEKTNEAVAKSIEVVTRSFDPEAPEAAGSTRYPEPLSTVIVTPTTIVNLALAAPAGRHLLMSAGNYDNLDIRVSNGTATNPIIARPLDPSNPPTFRGRTELFGDHFRLLGAVFDNRTVTATKALRINSRFTEIGWCTFRLFQAGIMLESGSPFDAYLHDLLFDGQTTTVSNGAEVIKIGWQQSYATDIRCRVERCKFVDCRGESEVISVKAAGTRLIDLHLVNSNNIWLRHGIETAVERVRADGSDIVCFGTDQLVRNVICNKVEFNKGTHDGDEVRVGAGGEYASCKRCVGQNITGELEIGREPFSAPTAWSFPAINCQYNNVTILDDVGTNTTLAGSVAVEAPPNYATDDVGQAAYVENVANTLTVTAVGTASNGTTAFDDESVTYTPDGSFVGEDEFTYTISNGDKTDIGRVYINVLGLGSGAFETPTGLWQADAYAALPSQFQDVAMLYADDTGGATQERLDSLSTVGDTAGPWGSGDPVFKYRRLTMRTSSALRALRDGRPAVRHSVKLINAFGVPDTVHDLKLEAPARTSTSSANDSVPIIHSFAGFNTVLYRWHLWADQWVGNTGSKKHCQLQIGLGNRGSGNKVFTAAETNGSTKGVSLCTLGPDIGGNDINGFGALVNHETDPNNTTWLTFGESRSNNKKAHALNRWVTVDQIIRVNDAGQSNGFYRIHTDNTHFDVTKFGIRFCDDPVNQMKAVAHEIRVMHGGNPVAAENRPVQDYNHDMGGFFIFKGNWVD